MIKFSFFCYISNSLNKRGDCSELRLIITTKTTTVSLHAHCNQRRTRHTHIKKCSSSQNSHSIFSSYQHNATRVIILIFFTCMKEGRVIIVMLSSSSSSTPPPYYFAIRRASVIVWNLQVYLFPKHDAFPTVNITKKTRRWSLLRVIQQKKKFL